MAEISRFFDTYQYSEADQADTQRRWRPTGVLYEVGSRLALSAPGGMVVRVAIGEAMVEGFHYKNTANLDKPIAANSSGSTRIDRIVLRLNRTGNAVTCEVLPGTPGAGAPGLTQVDGGTYEYLLGQVTVANGTLAITSGMILDQSTYGNIIHNSAEVGLAAAMPTTTEVVRRVLTADPANGNLYFAEPIAGRKNWLANTTFRVNQRQRGGVNANADWPVDRWQLTAVGTNPGLLLSVTNIAVPILQGTEARNCLLFSKGDASALPADGSWSTLEMLEGVEVQNLLGHNMVVSFWTQSTKTGVFGVNVEQLPSGIKYNGTFTINQANVWEFKWIAVPWNASGTWLSTAVGSLGVRFVAYATGNQKATVSNAWNSEGKVGAAALTNPLTASADLLYITSPKLEIGTIPTRYETPDKRLEEIEAFKYLYVVRQMQPIQVHLNTNFAVVTSYPVPMRVVPTFQVPVAPTFQNGVSPGANQVSVIVASAYHSNLTYNVWQAWFSSQYVGFTNLLSSTASTAPVGHSGLVEMGSNIYALFSAEM